MKQAYETITLSLVSIVLLTGYYAYRTHLELTGARLSAQYAQAQAKSYKQQWQSLANRGPLIESPPINYNPYLESQNTNLEGQNMDLEGQNMNLQDQLNQCQSGGGC